MIENKREIGTKHERIAGVFLEKQGYQILSYNYNTRVGEIDIIARQEGYLVFIEVKYRKNASSGHPLEAVSIQKQKKICKSAMLYMKKYGLEYMPVRFDVVGILGDKITLIQNAFEFIM